MRGSGRKKKLQKQKEKNKQKLGLSRFFPYGVCIKYKCIYSMYADGVSFLRVVAKVWFIEEEEEI